MKTKLKNIGSNTGNFIDGNPTSGELGTIVTAEWLNGVQERMQDVFEELKNVLLLADLQPDDKKTTQVSEAIKAYIQTFNLKIESNTRSLANVIFNSKKSNAVDSNSSDTVATSFAVKTAFQRAETNNLFQKIYVSDRTLSLDLTNRQQIISLFGNKYRQNGYLSFASHNDGRGNIVGLPLTTKSPVVLTFYLMGGYSIFYCHYPLLNRTYFSKANFNNETLVLDWAEQITSSGEQTINNQLNIKTGGWSKLKFPINNGGEWSFEINPSSETEPRFSIKYRMLNGSMRYCSFPVLGQNEVVAYRSWTDARIASNFTRGNLTTQNLDDVKAYGMYGQTANREATAERNYPTNYAGTLLVYPSAYNVMQQYINFRTGETYQRNVNIDLRTWSEWRRIDGLDKVSKSGDTMTGNLHIKYGDYSSVRTYNTANESVRWESVPASDASFAKITRVGSNDNVISAIYFPKKNGTAALIEDFTFQRVGNFEIRRYPDGTMIQTYIINQYDLKDWREKSFNWAQAFVYAPLIFEKILTSMDSDHACGLNILKKSNHTTCYYREYEIGSVNQGDVLIQFLAIGRWK